MTHNPKQTWKEHQKKRKVWVDYEYLPIQQNQIISSFVFFVKRVCDMAWALAATDPMFPLKPRPAMQRPKTPQWWSKFATFGRVGRLHTFWKFTELNWNANEDEFDIKVTGIWHGQRKKHATGSEPKQKGSERINRRMAVSRRLKHQSSTVKWLNCNMQRSKI